MREVVAEFQADLETLQALRGLQGDSVPAVGHVPWEWRERNALAPARLEISRGELVGLDDLAVRTSLEADALDFLVSQGVKRLDISKVRSKDRTVTQELAGILFERGAAGIVYRSNIDDNLCIALFEERARLAPAGEPEPLAGPVRGLKRVCTDFDLILSRRKR